MTRLLHGRRLLGRAGSLLTCLIPVAAVAAAPAGANSIACSVTNETTNTTVSSLATAIAAAQPNQTLHIAGTCTGNFTVKIPLTLQGVSIGATIDAGGHGTALTIDVPSGTVNVNLLEITGGSATDGGGILADPTGANTLTLSLDDDRLVDDQATSAGAGIYTGNLAALDISTTAITSDSITPGTGGAQGAAIWTSAPLDLYDSNLIANSVTAAATATVTGGAVYTTAPADLNIVKVNQTTVTGGSIDGAGVFASGPLTIYDSTIADNTATAQSGPITGVGVDATGASAQVGLTAALGNTAKTTSGAIRGVGVATATATALSFDNSSVYGNIATSTSGAIDGVGISGGADTLTDTGVYENDGSSGTGAVDGGGVLPGTSYSQTAGLVNMNKVSSSSAGANGGGLWSSVPTTISGATLSDNKASGAGGGVFLQEAPLKVASSSIVGNDAPSGGAIGNLGGSLTQTGSMILGGCALCG